jgi:hypothetical protein
MARNDPTEHRHEERIIDEARPSQRNIAFPAIINLTNRCGIVLALSMLLAGCHIFSLEASFDLAPSSRLPTWFTIPPGLSRSDVAVTMDYYSSPYKATFTLRNARTGWRITKVDGTPKGFEPLTLDHAHRPPYQYPLYEIITVGRQTEVIEHRKMEPLFYVTDDPGVLSKLGVSK